MFLLHKVYYGTTTQSIGELFSKRVSSRSFRVPNQFNIIRLRSETGRNSLRYRGLVIWNFVNRLVQVPESFYSFKQILCKYVKIIDNFSFLIKGQQLSLTKRFHLLLDLYVSLSEYRIICIH